MSSVEIDPTEVAMRHAVDVNDVFSDMHYLGVVERLFERILRTEDETAARRWIASAQKTLDHVQYLDTALLRTRLDRLESIFVR